MTSHYRHRRTATPATAFPTPVEPGEIVVNSANRQLVVGDADAAALGTPLLLLAVRYFDPRAQYTTGDLVVQAGALYRAKAAINPGAFNAANWDLFSSDVTIKAYADAGDAAVTSAFQAADTTLQTNINAKPDKTYVDAGDAPKADKTYVDAGDAALQTSKADKTYVDSQNAAQDTTITGKVAKAGDTMTGPLLLPGVKGSVFGNAGGTAAAAALAAADANIQLYFAGPNNWCGLGTDVPGNFWIRTGTSGSPAAAFSIDAAGQNVSGLAIATAAQYVADTPKKLLTTDAVWAAASTQPVTTAASLTPDFSASFDFFWILNSATGTLNNPTNLKTGQKGIIYIQQDASGGRTITTWGSSFKFPGGIKPALSTAANAVDAISYAVLNGTNIICTFSAGFA